MARSLAISKIQKLLGLPNPNALPKDEELPDGHMRLFNNWRPSLPAGLFSIEATQVVKGQNIGPTTIENAPTGTRKQPPGQQQFDVIAPQFSLDPSLINSYYPPDGHQDEGRILPHIVFSDPHVPWFREAGKTDWMTKLIDNDRSFVPWLALMVFKAEDLRVTPDEASSLKLNGLSAGMASPTDGSTSTTPIAKKVYDPANLPVTGAFGMTVGDYLTTVSSRVEYEESADFDTLVKSTDKTSIIFPSRSQVQSVFNPTNDTQFKGLQAQKLLSHVRQLNTAGCPDVGVSGHGFYSVVMSSMTGDLTMTTPTTHVVHLVSIEHLDKTLSTPGGSGRIGLVSLFSWTYHCIPEALNFEEMMKNLGTQAQPLRPPKQQMDALQDRSVGSTPSAKAAAKLYNRLHAGYTIARWRAPSGEESAAFNRGPLVPMVVSDVPQGSSTDKLPSWPALSMTGRDYLVFDKSIGMLDATYASAWSLGKLLAISDPAFNAALLRFRSVIWNTSTSNLRMDLNGVSQSTNILSSGVSAVSKAQDLSNGKFSGPVSRLNKPADVALAPSINDPSVASDLSKQIASTVTSSASVPGSKNALYNGFLLDSAASSDWEIIYNWIYDVMFLGHIPAHALFPEPSHLKSPITTPVVAGQTKLQPEALRFFHIDHAWIDCFLDGALSCANHVQPQYDTIRLQVKQIFNGVLSQQIGHLANLPPVPRYGFVLRSAAVKSTPDIKLTVKCWKSTPDSGNPGQYIWETDESRDPLLRHTKMDDYTILSLVDCLPEEIAYIELAQPAHQQRFAFGAQVTIDPSTGTVSKVASDVDVIKLFTNPKLAPPNDETGKPLDPVDYEWKALPTQLTSAEQTAFYDPTSRCIDSMAICEAMITKVVAWGTGNGCYDESGDGTAPHGVSCSSIFGLEMNDRAYHFNIPGTKPKPTDGPFKPWTRQIWAGPSQDPQSDSSTPSNATTKTGDTARMALAQPQHSNIVVPLPSGVPSKFPAPVNLHTFRAVAITESPIVSRATQPAASRFPIQIHPYTPSTQPEFELLVHPDYRPAPPRPDTLDNTYIFSIADSIPTQTTRLYDLIFSIRRRNHGNMNRTLRYLHIEIPLSLGSLQKDTQDLDGNGHRPREPLLVSDETSHGGALMAANPRFVPALFNGPASRINDGRWDNLDVLLITLTPRSGQEDGTMALLADEKSSVIAVRLANVVLENVVNPETINVYKKGPGGNGVVQDKISGRGRVPIRLTEVYGNDFPLQWSWCMAVKADVGDQKVDSAV